LIDLFIFVASDQVYHLLFHGRWFSPGTPASSTTKNDCYDIAEILLKVANWRIRKIMKTNIEILTNLYVTKLFS
jgi:hypothetical protein